LLCRASTPSAEIESATGTVVHAFTTGAMVQMYLLTAVVPPLPDTHNDMPPAGFHDGPTSTP